MTLLNQWDDPDIPPTSAFNNPYNEIWGYEADGHEYAIIASTLGTHILEITDINNVVEVDFVPGAAQGSSIVHRDMHDYAGYLYMVCQEGPSTLQIADLSYLPDSVHLVYDSNELIKGSHNIFIDTASAKLYAMDVNPPSGSFIGLRILSLEDPVNPEFLIDMYIGSDVHDIFVRNDTAFLNRGWNSSLEVWNFADTQNPVLLGSLSDYPGQGYNHAGYLDASGNTYVLADETHGSPLKIMDVSDLSDMEIVSTVTSGVASNSIPHNPIIHGDLMYSSYYYDGIYVWNIADPLNPQLLGFYDTSTIPNGNGYQGCWGVYPFLSSGKILASDMQNGLFILELDETVTGINEQSGLEDSFQLYPNPSQGAVYLSFDNSKGNVFTVTIYTLTGQKVYVEHINKSTTELDISGFEKGLYLVELAGETVLTKKLVVK
jgi:choice-of-anchor B domain-containing protein